MGEERALAIDAPARVRAGEGPFASDGICPKITCLENYVGGFIEVLERAKFTVATRYVCPAFSTADERRFSEKRELAKVTP